MPCLTIEIRVKADLPSSYWPQLTAKSKAMMIPWGKHFHRVHCGNIFCQISLKAELKKQEAEKTHLTCSLSAIGKQNCQGTEKNFKDFIVSYLCHTIHYQVTLVANTMEPFPDMNLYRSLLAELVLASKMVGKSVHEQH